LPDYVQLKEDLAEYEDYIRTLCRLRGRSDQVIPGALRRYRWLLKQRHAEELRDQPHEPTQRLVDPFWQILLNKDLGSPFLSFVAYLAIQGGSLRAARDHYRVDRWTFGDWLHAARSALRRPRQRVRRTA
jgi:hypothetical protein